MLWPSSSVAIAKHVFGGSVHPMDRPVQSGCDNGVRRGIDDGVITRILPVAQNAFARNGDRDIADLQ